MPFTSPKTSTACGSPDGVFFGRSICVTSPVMTNFASRPIRVRNILSWALVAFCASSRMTKAWSKVLPLINASGAISMVPSSMYPVSFACGIMSRKASYNGCRYGSSFSFKSPGRNPRFSPASTAGLVKIIRLTSLFFNALTASATAV